MKLAVVHDLAEALAGDIAPFQNVSKEDKRRLEEDGLEKICSTLGSEPIGGWMDGWVERLGCLLSLNPPFFWGGGYGEIQREYSV